MHEARSPSIRIPSSGNLNVYKHLENNPKQTRALIGLKPCFHLTNRFHAAVRLFMHCHVIKNKIENHSVDKVKKL